MQVHDRDRKDGICPDDSYGLAKIDLYRLYMHNLQEIDYEVPVVPHIAHRANWDCPAAGAREYVSAARALWT